MKAGIVIVFLSLWCSAQSKCVMRGTCAVVGGFDKPCPVYDDAIPITQGLLPEEADEVRDILAHRCPSLAYDDDGNLKPHNETHTCCTAAQIREMSESLLIAEGVLGRCPTCLRNFARQICEMNCSPDQSRYVFVEEAIASDGEPYVDVINYRVFGQFMDDAHASCRDVILPQTGVQAIMVMCGSATECDADAWFGFTGDMSTNPLAPVQVNFLRWNTTEDSMNADAPPCNETVGDDWPCSCVDCFANCPLGNEPIIPDICTVIGVHCAGFSVAIVFFVITVTVFIILTIYDYNKMRNIESKPSKSGPRDINAFTKFFQVAFAKLGVKSACHPAVVIMMTSWLVFAMFFGVININITSDPLELWSAPDSRSRAELNYFNSRFGPFYRAAQVFLTIDLDPVEFNNFTYGPAFQVKALEELVKLEQAIIDIGRDEGGVTLEQVCYSPNRPVNSPPNLELCVSMSASVYLGDQKNDINNQTYLSTIQSCLNNHFNLGCLASWGGGSEPELTFGGYDYDIRTANTLLINFPITNHLLEQNLRPVLEWEQKFINLMQDYEENWKADFVEVAFGAERSIEDEIDRIALAEAVTVIISYVIMFIYVIVALGNIRSCKTLFVDSKIMIAVGSFIIVAISIFCAMGVMGYLGMTISLIAINVIPFFILSVGIDNVFLMVNTLQDIQDNLKQFDDYDENFSYSKKRNFVFEKMLGKVGPSIFVTSVTQITCFAIGSLTNFPVVVTFAIFCTISLAFLFVFQVTTVVSLLSIDYKRASQNRFDVLWCIRKKILDDDDPLNATRPYKSITQRLMEPYSKFILDWRVKITVAILFMGMASVSIVLIPQIEIGLDQEMAMPADSYVYKYLQAVNHLMHIGPPVFFVLKSGLNFSDVEHQNTVCGSQLCNVDSLTTQIFLASLHSDITYIARSSNSWLDDFIEWSGLYGSCCKYNTTDDSFCPSMDISQDCAYCTIERNQDWFNGLRPSRSAFNQYISFFLQDEPSEICNKGGLASYAASVNYVLDSQGNATIQDTNFMAFHTSLVTSKDYISAVKYGYEISDNITRAIQQHTGTDVEVFPYSVFYVFFEQYLTMWGDTFTSLGYCLIGALVFNLLASGFSIITTFTVIFTTVLIVVNMMGVMYIWNIPLNAVSNMNLIVSIGIAVEFCSHIGYSFNISQRPPRERVEDAILSVGATIITGITFTNIPIIVLAFAYTEIIVVFFFRMFFSIVVLGFLHGMIFFPVLLSYAINITS